MPVTIKELPQSEVLITVELGPEKAQEFFDKAFSEMASSLEIKGFRKGKIPKDIAKKHILQKDILEKGADLAVRETYPDIIAKQKIDVISQPDVQIKKIAEGSPLVYEAKVAVYPEFKIPEYRNIKFSRKPVEVSDKELATSLAWIRKSRAKYKVVLRPAKKGDQVEVNFISKLNGVVVEGGSAQKYKLILGEEKFIPGFEDQISGMSKGESKSFSLTFPEDYSQKMLAGKLVDFELTVNDIQDVEIPTLDDEFAKSLGDFNDISSLKKSVIQGLTQEKEAKETQRLRAEILDSLTKKVEVELPDTLIDLEIEKMAGELRSSVESSGMKFEDYLRDILKKEEGELRKGWHDLATNRVLSAFLLKEIAQREVISASEEEIEERFQKELTRYGTPKEAEKKVDEESLKRYIKNILTNEKVLEFLEGLATNKEEVKKSS